MTEKDELTSIIWIVNAAPFIGLAKIGRLELLVGSGRTVYLPEIVVREIKAGPPHDAAVEAIDRFLSIGAGTMMLSASPPNSRLAKFALDAGEVAVLTEVLARPGSVAVIDDGPGRAAGKSLGIPIRGTVGVLALARRQGKIPALAPELRGLQAAGLYLPREDVLRGLLSAMGEDWP